MNEEQPVEAANIIAKSAKTMIAEKQVDAVVARQKLVTSLANDSKRAITARGSVNPSRAGASNRCIGIRATQDYFGRKSRHGLYIVDRPSQGSFLNGDLQILCPLTDGGKVAN